LLEERAAERRRVIWIADRRTVGCVEERSAVANRPRHHVPDRHTAPAFTDVGTGGVRARVGFRPTRPQHDAGMRIEPPPSVACAAGITPAATAAPAPPLDPPEVFCRFHGLRHTPSSTDSVVTFSPNFRRAGAAEHSNPAAR
jgi:hypothetical protein